jgi:type I restriction enzyme S subunit
VVGIEAREGVEPFWLYSVLTCFKVALDRASTQNAQKNINLQTLRPLQIPVPPRALMIELAETLAAAADGARQANAAIENLMALKRSIQGDLLSGHVRVPA